MRDINPELRSVQPEAMTAIGRDMPAALPEESWMRHWRRVVVVAPHCDDLELGCGGLIARLSAQSAEVTQLVMAAGDLQQGHRACVTDRSLRVEETQQAAHTLGIGHIHFAFTEESRLDAVPMVHGVEAIQKTIDLAKPDLLLVNLPSSNQDHRWVYDCTISALRPWRTGHRPRTVLGYEYPLLYWGGYAETEMPVYVDVTDHMTAKLRAVAAHRSQLRPGPLSQEAVEVFCRQRGIEAGVTYAERYKLILARL